MKGKPSDYLDDNNNGHRRFLKPGDVPADGSSYVITEIETVKQTNRWTGENERLVRLGLDSGWLFDLKKRNLATAINLLGDSFDGWLDKRLYLRASTFTRKEDGSEQVYLQVVRPFLTLSSKTRPTPQDETGTSSLS